MEFFGKIFRIDMNHFLSGKTLDTANKLLATLDQLLSVATDKYSAIEEHELRGLCSRVKSARSGFPFVMEEVPCQKVDRLGSVLLGPVFTSQPYPWPMDDNAEPMAPLCQLDTALFPVQMDAVEGLVQVWLSQSGDQQGEALVRVIPSAEADASLLTPVIPYESDIEVLLPDAAEWLRDFHSELKPSKNQFITEAALKLGHASADALEDTDWDEWIRLAEIYGDTYGDDVVMCSQITGFAESRIYCTTTLDQQNAVAKLEKLKKKLLEKSTPEDAAVIALLHDVCSAYEAWRDCCGKDEYPCFLGTFHHIQYAADDRDPPLLCFESIGLREWGDGGNAQVFYSKEKGFSFDWSCS
ncbi:hypothetical protein B9Z51_07495 [Limnohabitans sp. T6-5]|uniref:hypothetical protein n=1 Tax=Limnohabitans sp. T6-5 TaxID=1100724 RepID=UPI000D3D824D|nr:hypothetical protein [Limnohabitans sp. T6-5]PUE08778.1 hypothetical protein B9Z51_07495 [Limnohabitans sp. T6-5]